VSATTEGAAAPDPLATARAEMAPGETLIWADRPTPRASRIWPMMLFGMLVFGFALFWTAQAWQAGGAIAIFGLPFLGIGAVLLAAPWWRPKRARHTVYAISDQRLLIIRGWPTRVVQSFAPQDIGRLERHEREDGGGDLIFLEEDEPQVLGGRHHARRRWRRRRIGFLGIAEVRRVEAAVRALQRGEADATHERPS
jgi:hypothetical protein